MEPISQDVQNMIYSVGLRAEQMKKNLGLSQADPSGFEAMYHNVFGVEDSYQAPQMDMSDIEEDALNSVDQSKMKDGWIIPDAEMPEIVPEDTEPEEETQEVEFSVPPENIHLSEKFKKRLEEAEKKESEEPKIPTQKIVDTIMKIIHRDIKNQIIQTFRNRKEIFNDTKLDNEVKNWYWNVGFVNVEVEDNLITLIVHRPNKFIGKNNYLFSLRNVLKNLGFELDLKKAPNDDLYKAFFGE